MWKWVFSHLRRTKVRVSPHLRARAVESASYSVHLEISWKLLKKKDSNTWPDRAHGYLCQLYEHMT